MPGEFLFSYGTLQLEPVQLATFGRLLTGERDVLQGFEETELVIEDEAVIAISGRAKHTIAKFTGLTSDTISGTRYEVTPGEIQSADKYEVAPCQRVDVVLQSGRRAWVYVDGRFSPPLGQVSLGEERPDSPEAVQLIAELDAYLAGHPYPQESRHAFSIEKLVHEGVAFFVTRMADEPVGCGALKLFSDYGEVKRMYVRPTYRGLGLGKAMLDHLAHYVRERQMNLLRLETGIYQTEAIGLYEAYGFQRRPPFGEYKDDPLSVYFEKTIT